MIPRSRLRSVRRLPAMCLAAALALTGCTGDDTSGAAPASATAPSSPPSPLPSPSPSPSPPPSPSPSPSPSVLALDTLVEAGPGLPELFLADGLVVSVAGAATDDCPGTPPRSLERVSLPDGARTPVDGGAGVGRIADVGATSSPRLVLTATCDGVLTAVRTATLGDDGEVRDLTDVPPAPELSQIDPETVQWATGADALLALAYADDDTARVVGIGPDGEVTDVAPTPPGTILGLGVLDDGRYVYRQGVSAGVLVADATGDVTATFEGREGFAVAPDGRTLAVFGPAGLAVAGSDGSMTSLLDDAVSGAAWTLDGRAIVVAVGSRGVPEADVRIVGLDGESAAVPLVVDPFSPLVVAPSGTAVAGVAPLAADGGPVAHAAPLTPVS